MLCTKKIKSNMLILKNNVKFFTNASLYNLKSVTPEVKHAYRHCKINLSLDKGCFIEKGEYANSRTIITRNDSLMNSFTLNMIQTAVKCYEKHQNVYCLFFRILNSNKNFNEKDFLTEPWDINHLINLHTIYGDLSRNLNTSCAVFEQKLSNDFSSLALFTNGIIGTKNVSFKVEYNLKHPVLTHGLSHLLSNTKYPGMGVFLALTEYHLDSFTMREIGLINYIIPETDFLEHIRNQFGYSNNIFKHNSAMHLRNCIEYYADFSTQKIILKDYIPFIDLFFGGENNGGLIEIIQRLIFTYNGSYKEAIRIRIAGGSFEYKDKVEKFLENPFGLPEVIKKFILFCIRKIVDKGPSVAMIIIEQLKLSKKSREVCNILRDELVVLNNLTLYRNFLKNKFKNDFFTKETDFLSEEKWKKCIYSVEDNLFQKILIDNKIYKVLIPKNISHPVTEQNFMNYDVPENSFSTFIGGYLSKRTFEEGTKKFSMDRKRLINHNKLFKRIYMKYRNKIEEGNSDYYNKLKEFEDEDEKKIESLCYLNNIDKDKIEMNSFIKKDSLKLKELENNIIEPYRKELTEILRKMYRTFFYESANFLSHTIKNKKTQKFIKSQSQKNPFYKDYIIHWNEIIEKSVSFNIPIISFYYKAFNEERKQIFSDLVESDLKITEREYYTIAKLGEKLMKKYFVNMDILEKKILKKKENRVIKI